jgi:hypothetical protein
MERGIAGIGRLGGSMMGIANIANMGSLAGGVSLHTVDNIVARKVVAGKVVVAAVAVVVVDNSKFDFDTVAVVAVAVAAAVVVVAGIVAAVVVADFVGFVVSNLVADRSSWVVGYFVAVVGCSREGIDRGHSYYSLGQIDLGRLCPAAKCGRRAT